MKKGIFVAAIAGLLFAMPTRSDAHDYDRDDSDHILRYVAYVVHPIGMAVDQWLLRPIHRFVHRDEKTLFWFGHEEGTRGATWTEE